MKNKYLENIISDWQSGKITVDNQILNNALRNMYAYPNADMIIVDNIMQCEPTEWRDFIYVMHKANVKKFLFAENSTATLSNLYSLLSLPNTSVIGPLTLENIKPTYDMDLFGSKAGLVISIPEKRS